MSEEILIEMSRQIGELNGTVQAYTQSQAATNKALFALAEKHDARLGSLEGIKNKMIGATVLSALGGSGIATTIAKLFGSPGQ